MDSICIRRPFQLLLPLQQLQLLPLLLPLLLLPSAVITAQAQVYPDSPVFRNYRPDGDRHETRNEGLRRQINVFLLERDAANGDPLARHELGVRLLTGSGVQADTVRSAEWLRKAAAQSLVPAMYNYALLQHNGWGTEWDPFAAYRLFRAAAERGMIEAQYVTGIFFTDDLVLQQNWDSAWTWIAKAAITGYEPAVRAREEILRRGHVRLSADSTLAPAVAGESPPVDDGHSMPSWTPVLLDFSRKPQGATVATSTLLEETLASRNLSARDSLSLKMLLDDTAIGTFAIEDPPTNDRIASGDSSEAAASEGWKLLNTMAEWSNPEATVLLGRLHDEGRVVPRDAWRAAELHASAVFLESPRAPLLLMEILRDERVSDGLPERAWAGDARAQYVWACLKAMDIETRLSDAQALDLLKRAVARNHAPSITQLGICHATGRWVAPDPHTAEELWIRAAGLRQHEARLRLAAAAVHGRSERLDIAGALAVLEKGTLEGSLLAAVALAGSYERGVGRSANIGEAVRRYRDCAVRGSGTAWHALLRLHDNRRPEEAEFHIRR